MYPKSDDKNVWKAEVKITMYIPVAELIKGSTPYCNKSGFNSKLALIPNVPDIIPTSRAIGLKVRHLRKFRYS